MQRRNFPWPNVPFGAKGVSAPFLGINVIYEKTYTHQA